MLGVFIDRCFKKSWSQEDIERYVGPHRKAYLTHATDLALREKAASGGSASAILIDGLKRGCFDGAVVCKATIENGKVRARFSIATSVEEILAARGSKYVETRFLREVLPLIRDFDGRVAVVGLPCDITALRNRSSKEPELARKLVLTLALFCGHNSRTNLIDSITARIERETGEAIAHYRFSVGHWRGHLEAELTNGRVVQKPSKVFKDFQNLFFFCERKCLACHDHFGYASDLTLGDIWLFRLKADPIKHTAIITRTQAGENAFDGAVRAGNLQATEIDIRDVLDGQARIAPSHYNVSARAKAGRWLGVKLPDPVNERVKWHAYLNAFISISAVRLSEKNWGQNLIFATPRPLLKVFLYLKKGLESFK
ncbi:MAG: Coenzyme F420 hydrogenase/dehydrogenase, beta subunit C-terminal domain [Halochromatium sp.]